MKVLFSHYQRNYLAIGMAMLLLCCLWGSIATAHSAGSTSVGMEIWPQRTFFTVRIYGDGEDLRDATIANAHATPADKVTELTLENIKKAEQYFSQHIMLKQDDVRLTGTLLSLRLWHADFFDPSLLGFEAIYRFPRDPHLASAPLQVTSALFDFVGKAVTVISVRGTEKSILASQTAGFPAAVTSTGITQNSLDWLLLGISHIVTNPVQWIFLLALLFASLCLPLRVIGLSVGIYAVSGGITFALSLLPVLKEFQMGALSSSPIAAPLMIAAAAIYGWWLARAEGRSKQIKVSILIAITTICGFVHGLMAAPLWQQRGVPETGLLIPLLCFVLGVSLALAVLCLLIQYCLRLFQKKIENNAQYGGLAWPRVQQWACCGIAAIACLWAVQNLLN